LSKSRNVWILTGLILIWAIIATGICVKYYGENAMLQRTVKSQAERLGKIRMEVENATERLMRASEEAGEEKAYGTLTILQEISENMMKIQKIIGGKIKVNLAIDYGNGTRKWYNNTLVESGTTLLDLTIKVANVNYTSYHYGAFLNAINGVENNPKTNNYWLWWRWNGKNKEWRLGSLACDKYILSNGETIIWIYENTFQWPPKPP